MASAINVVGRDGCGSIIVGVGHDVVYVMGKALDRAGGVASAGVMDALAPLAILFSTNNRRDWHCAALCLGIA